MTSVTVFEEVWYGCFTSVFDYYPGKSEPPVPVTAVTVNGIPVTVDGIIVTHTE